MNKLKNSIIIALLLVLICIIIYTFSEHSEIISLVPDNNTIDWKGNQELAHEEKEQPKIAIPGVASPLVFYANTTKQKVNFCNPATNNCLFLLSLYVDDVCYWQSGYIQPSKGYYEIELTESLSKGEYNAYLLTQCYREDGTTLNSARVKFTLKVIE